MRATFACIAVVAALLSAPTALAQESPQVAWNAGIASDYVFRGFSQTAEEPAVFAGVDLTIGDIYAGAWASNVDFGDDTEAELDLYGGYRTELAGFAVDVGAVGYLYASQPNGADYDYAELKVAASRAVGPLTAGVAVYWSPDFFAADGEATYVEGNVTVSPAPQWTVSGAIGYQALDVTADYTTWNAGAAYAFNDHLVLDLRYHDTDVSGPLSGERAVATLKFLF